MKLKLRKSDSLEDWFVIEKASVDGAREMRHDAESGCMYLYDPARISDACVEGTAEEMKSLGVAIRARGSESHKRCAVRVVGETAHFWSPRNSREKGKVSLADADDLAVQIEALP